MKIETMAAVGVLGASLLVGVAPAGAAETSDAALAGTCHFTGTEVFEPPLGLVNKPTRAVVEATGRCTGTVRTADGTRPLRGAAATYTQDVRAPAGSCVGAGLRGAGTITVDGVRLPFDISEPQVGAVAAMQVSAPAWRAAGVAYLTPTAGLANTVLSCLGTGVQRIPVTIALLNRARG